MNQRMKIMTLRTRRRIIMEASQGPPPAAQGRAVVMIVFAPRGCGRPRQPRENHMRPHVARLSHSLPLEAAQPERSWGIYIMLGAARFYCIHSYSIAMQRDRCIVLCRTAVSSTAGSRDRMPRGVGRLTHAWSIQPPGDVCHSRPQSVGLSAQPQLPVLHSCHAKRCV